MIKQVAIVHFNTPELTEACILSIRKHGGQDYRIVVFDNSDKRPFTAQMKGVKAMHEGALDAYDTVMFRCRYSAAIDRWCLLQYHGKWYQITSFNEDYQENQIQMTATELANQQVNIVDASTSDI